MTPTQLADEIEALAKEATQAPWGIETESKSRGTYLVRRLSKNTFIPAAQTLSLQESANAALIVALVNNAPAIVSALREVSALKEEVERLRGVLTRIERWFGEFPETGMFWTNEDGSRSDRPMSYGAAYGSNGERDYMRAIARAALGGGG